MSSQGPDGKGAGTPVGEPPGKEVRAPRHRRSKAREEIIRELKSATVITFVLAACWAAFDQTEFGEGFSQLSYGFLQRRLSSQGPSSVRIVDISELEQKNGITPRDKLQWLLAALKDVQPKVIGIDVDFSPEERSSGAPGAPKRWQFVASDDYKFFEYCRSLGVPVYLGVYRTQLLDPNAWLGMERYANLGATLLAPETPKKALQSSEVRKGLTMASALAAVDSKVGEAPRNKWLVFERASKSESEAIPWEGFLVDYSRIEKLQSDAIKVRRESFGNPEGLKAFIDSKKGELEGRRILVGDVAHYGDPFPNLRQRGSIPGVLIHAAAAETLLGKPLYDMVEWLKGWGDFLLAEVILLIVLGLRWYNRRIDEDVLKRTLAFLAVAAAVVLGVTVNRHRVLWDGFLMVAVSFVVEPVAPEILGLARRWLHLSEHKS